LSPDVVESPAEKAGRLNEDEGIAGFCDVEYDQQVMALQTPFRGILVANEDEWGNSAEWRCKRRSM
jgi:hypothetical protein